MVTVGMATADVERMEALMIGVLVVWALVALGVAVVIGRGVRIADVRAADPLIAPEPVGELRLRTPRRRIPLPPVGVALVATAVLLETAGFIGRLTGATGPVAH